MLFTNPLATVRLKCKGLDFSADIHPPTPWQFSVQGGTIIGKFCWMKLSGHPLEQLFAGDASPFPGLTDAEHRKVDELLPKAALMALINVVCGESKTHPQLAHMVSFQLNSLNHDPQVFDAADFRKRCRYDALRIVHQFLSRHPAQLRVGIAELKGAGWLSRLYEDNELVDALMYWKEKGFLSIPTKGPVLRIDVNKDESIAEEVEKYNWEECGACVNPRAAERTTKEYDVFICHASEDKTTFVDALARDLQSRGFKVWYDSFVLKIGDSLRREIDRGLAQSRFGIVVLSKNFFSKEWPQKELDALDSLEVHGRKVILPIWHALDREEVQRYSPLLAGRVAAKSGEGLESVIAKLSEVLE